LNWTVEVTHAATGEEMVVGVEAATREQAAAAAADGGFHVRDCYSSGLGFYKGDRYVAWVWFGFFALQAISALACGFAGGLATPGDSGIKGGLAVAGATGVAAALGLLAVRALTSALRRDASPDPRRGFDVVATEGERVESPPR
jgi:hypothetical protein